MHRISDSPSQPHTKEPVWILEGTWHNWRDIFRMTTAKKVSGTVQQCLH